MARDARLLAGLAAAFAVSLVVAVAGSAASPPSSSPLILHWDGSAWTQAPVAGGGDLSAVTAVSTADVWAFGTYKIRTAIAEHWDGSVWKQVTMPNPKDADEVELQSAAAGSATNLWVAGSWASRKTGGYRTLVEHWNGTAWKIVRTPNPSGNARLGGITVLSARNAWAVGSYVVTRPGRRSSAARTLVLHWNGRKWRRVHSPNPTSKGGRQSDALAAVAAVSARNVWAVGDYFHRGAGGRHSYVTLVLHWNGKRWQRAPSPNPGGLGHANALDAVSADPAGHPWAVGGYRNGSGLELPLVERRAGAWRAVSAPAPASPELELASVAPLSTDDVWAAGWYLDDAQDLEPQTLAEHWDGHDWTIVPTPNPAREDTLSGIAAVSASDVWAVGTVANP